MITSMKIQNFKCFKDFEIELGPFNVLIGPNDSGKTSFLHSLRLATYLASDKKAISVNGWEQDNLEKSLEIPLGKEAIWRTQETGRMTIGVVGFEVEDPLPKAFSIRSINQIGNPIDSFVYWIQNEELDKGKLDLRKNSGSIPGGELGDDWLIWASETIGSSWYLNFNPSSLRKPTPLSERKFDLSSSGEGLPRFLNDIWGSDREAFLALENEFYKKFPEYKKIILSTGKLSSPSTVGQVIRFETVHHEQLSANSVSDGALLSLAFLAICHQPSPPKILLVEEPENGVHHASLENIVDLLREISEKKGVQVIMTTHSPYLLNLVEPKEILAFRKDDEGAVTSKKLSDFSEVDRMKKDFMPGEMWAIFSETEGI